MLRALKFLCQKVLPIVRRVAGAIAARVIRRLRSAWTAHRVRVATDSGYAAVTALVLGAVLGVVPIREASTAVLAALAGVYALSRPTVRAAPRRGFDRWDANDDWDYA